jgi:hypothetical protein
MEGVKDGGNVGDGGTEELGGNGGWKGCRPE